MRTLWLDFETRSACALPKRGAYNYAQDPSTEILCASWALDDAPVQEWHAWKQPQPPAALLRALQDKRVQVRAHNASFDRLIAKYRLDVNVPVERWYCTATQARAMALPGALGDLSRAINSTVKKDTDGTRLITLCCIPQKDGTFISNTTILTRLAAYCSTDVETMRAVSDAIAPLDAATLAVYWTSERINDTGLPIDTELCAAALRYAERANEEALTLVRQLSSGALRTVRGTGIRDWIYARLPAEMQKIMHVYQDGAQKRSLAVDVRAMLLAYAEEEPDAAPADVVEMIVAADLAAFSSVGKYQAMLNRVGADGRLRGAFMMNGASQTGRFSSHGAQLHNFPRLVAKNPDAVRDSMLRGEALPGSTLAVLKSMLRPAIRPAPGRSIVRCDWSAIEARALPWLAKNADEYLGAFSTPGRDVYIEQAIKSGLGEARQAGKVVVLSLGYGGGPGALERMAKAYDVKIADAPGVVARWRSANSWAVHWWQNLIKSADTVLTKRTVVQVGRVRLAGSKAWLMLVLPSGRLVHYPQARPTETGDLEYLKAAWKPKVTETVWPRARLWHGTLAENATQAACADLLRECLVRLSAAAAPVIGHVHDEIILECETGEAQAQGGRLRKAMLDAPAWAEGLPLAAEVDIAPYFRK